MATKKFEVTTVPLKGSNLIEASAGTGKTYSIAILVVRMVIEEEFSLKQILMVTFTKAAVAELEVRIRYFIREAYAFAKHQKEIDSTIKQVVENGIKSKGEAQVVKLLNQARKQLDETSIFTIHSFCQKTLTEYAFETGQSFNSSVVEDEAQLRTEAINQYWRQEITTLEPSMLAFLVPSGLSKSCLDEVVKKSVWGRRFIYNSEIVLSEATNNFKSLEQKVDAAINSFNTQFETSPERNLSNFSRNSHANKAFSTLVDLPHEFMTLLLDKQDKDYVNKCFPNLLSLALEVPVAQSALNGAINEVIYYLYGRAIDGCKELVAKMKADQFLFSFDDLITKLHQTVASVNLQTLLRNQYKAVFIDEFQDTDQKQYEIFNTLFHHHSILFYIGDPKQSIYSFKGTDIDTYLDAAQKVDNTFTMSTNFRSTPQYVEALNNFLNIDNPFADERIKYELVKAGKPLDALTCNNELVEPLSLYSCKNKDIVVEQTVAQIYQLLTSGYKIGTRAVIPSDIAVLVRANDKGADVKKALSKLHIPAITIDDCKVMETEHGVMVLNLLKAFNAPTKPNVNKALLSCLTPFSKLDLLSTDMEYHFETFKKLQKEWNEKGVFSTLNTFMSIYNVQDHLYKNHSADADRIITNIMQINEIVHNKEVQSKLLPQELIHWVANEQAGGGTTTDTTQRLESDEEAVKIVTIHKSKGLQYNIVVAPYLDLTTDLTHRTIVDYKDPNLNQYCFSYAKLEREVQLYSLQTECENRRLIYVALTRAVYKAIVLSNEYFKTGSIKYFINASINSKQLVFGENLIPPTGKYKEVKMKVDKTPKSFSQVPITTSGKSYSFSRLSNHEPHSIPPANQSVEGYNDFIFNQFPKGPLAGSFLHYIFENATFTAPNFSRPIVKAKHRYSSLFGKESNVQLDSNLNDLISHVLHVKLPIEEPFLLSQVTDENRLVEMEFNFKMEGFTTAQLLELIPNINLATIGNIEGFMVGFIDLLFQHNGKFYILDWKSNHLGNDLAFYQPDKLEQAIVANNYHLQYSIYTVATVLYLQSVMPHFNYNTHFGGILYLFARGCRNNESTGVYHTKPSEDLVHNLTQLLSGTSSPKPK